MTKLSLTNLEKATAVLQDLRKLDMQINKIEKLAHQFATGKNTIRITLEAVDEIMREKEQSKVSIEEDGSLDFSKSIEHARYSIIQAMGIPGLRPFGQSSAEPYRDKFAEEIDDVIALEILAVIIQVKQTRRMVLLRQLEKLGVKV